MKNNLTLFGEDIADIENQFLTNKLYNWNAILAEQREADYPEFPYGSCQYLKIAIMTRIVAQNPHLLPEIAINLSNLPNFLPPHLKLRDIMDNHAGNGYDAESSCMEVQQYYFPGFQPHYFNWSETPRIMSGILMGCLILKGLITETEAFDLQFDT